MLYVGMHFHGYQPPTQSDKTIEKIFQESYEPIIKFIEDNETAFLSIDIARSLGERLPKQFLTRVARLINKKQIEIINTAAYHYLLPLVPPNIALRQLNLNYEFYNKFFLGYKNGVFLPEMAFSTQLIPIIIESGSSWLIADDDAFARMNSASPPEKRVPQNWIPLFSGCGILLRSRFWSNKISWAHYDCGNNFAKEFVDAQHGWRKNCAIEDENYTIISVDMETIGHHQPNAIEKFMIPFFGEIEKQKNRCKVVPIDFIFKRFEKRFVSHYLLPPNSWSTEDLSVPFPLWHNLGNQFHNLWNEFMEKTFEMAPKRPSLELQAFLDKAFYSCSPWQYSHGNYEIAAWCFPYFEKIIKLLNSDERSMALQKIYEKMRDLINSKNK